MKKALPLLIATLLSACATSTPPTGLTGVWQIQEVGQVSPENLATIEFQSDEHRFYTRGGCNNMFGKYREHKGTLKMFDTITTLKACESSLMNLDDSLSAAFENTASYQISGQHLEIRNAQGQTLIKAIKAADK
ncbi:META domain-containing protein [Neisseria sp. 83E34]|uniref:META domain-containing protein n=1 Tax=Neisseria sp. 83E34 TaxID=1692264 RepID=UPI0006CE9A11|nr:META domain-containing protein [Neisseria sp. 83E34]KPN71346.1 hypothetical protein AKG09_07780 [Neisseria sp. 83E34]